MPQETHFLSTPITTGAIMKSSFSISLVLPASTVLGTTEATSLSVSSSVEYTETEFLSMVGLADRLVTMLVLVYLHYNGGNPGGLDLGRSPTGSPTDSSPFRGPTDDGTDDSPSGGSEATDDDGDANEKALETYLNWLNKTYQPEECPPDEEEELLLSVLSSPEPTEEVPPPSNSTDWPMWMLIFGMGSMAAKKNNVVPREFHDVFPPQVSSRLLPVIGSEAEWIDAMVEWYSHLASTGNGLPTDERLIEKNVASLGEAERHELTPFAVKELIRWVKRELINPHVASGGYDSKALAFVFREAAKLWRGCPPDNYDHVQLHPSSLTDLQEAMEQETHPPVVHQSPTTVYPKAGCEYQWFELIIRYYDDIVKDIDRPVGTYHPCSLPAVIRDVWAHPGIQELCKWVMVNLIDEYPHKPNYFYILWAFKNGYEKYKDGMSVLHPKSLEVHIGSLGQEPNWEPVVEETDIISDFYNNEVEWLADYAEYWHTRVMGLDKANAELLANNPNATPSTTDSHLRPDGFNGVLCSTIYEQPLKWHNAIHKLACHALDIGRWNEPHMHYELFSNAHCIWAQTPPDHREGTDLTVPGFVNTPIPTNLELNDWTDIAFMQLVKS